MRFLIVFVLTVCAAHAAPRFARSQLSAAHDQLLRKLFLRADDSHTIDDLSLEKIFNDEIDSDDQETDSDESAGSHDFIAVVAIIEDPKSHKPIFIMQEIPLDVTDTSDEPLVPEAEPLTTPEQSDPTPEPEPESELGTEQPQPGGTTPEPSPAQELHASPDGAQ